MGRREIIEMISSSSSEEERDHEEEGNEGEEEGHEGGGEEEEDCVVSTNNTNKSKNKEEEEEKNIREGVVGGGPSYSSCSFPMSRIKRLMKNEGVVHFRTTPDFVFLMNKATVTTNYIAFTERKRPISPFYLSLSLFILSSQLGLGLQKLITQKWFVNWGLKEKNPQFTNPFLGYWVLKIFQFSSMN